MSSSTRLDAAGLAPRWTDAPRALKLPDAQRRLHYGAAYWAGAVASLLGPHRLRPERAHRYAAEVAIGAPLRQRWQRLFRVPAEACVPLLHHQAAATLLCTRLLADLGVNRRHVLHLRHRTVHGVDAASFATADRLRLSCGLRRAVQLDDDKVMLEVETLALGADGRRLAGIEDGYLVRELPALDLFALPRDRALVRELHGLRRRWSLLDPGARGACHRPLALPPRLAADYGRLAGDVNPVHTGGLGAWLCGVDEPFLQGLALRNLVVRELALLGAPLGRVRLTFARPARLGQTLGLVVAGERFEVHDAYRRLIAFGALDGAA